MIKYVCSHCGKDAVVKEQDVFYSCAECWIKANKGKKYDVQSTLRRKGLHGDGSNG